MTETLVPIVVMTGMFAMIFGITYIRSRENMAMIEKGLNPRNKDPRPRPFVNLKWGLLLIGSGLGFLFAYIIDNTIIKHDKTTATHTSITIGGHHSGEKRKVVVITDTNRIAKDTAANNTSASANNAKDDDGDNEDDDNVTGISSSDSDNPALYFALIAIGGGLGLFFSYRIEKKEWLDKKIEG